MRRTNRIVALLLAGVMVAGSITGCSSSIKKKSAKLEKGDITDSSIVITVGDQGIKYSEVKNYCYFLKNQYEGSFGEKIWSYSVGKDTTIGDEAKEEVINMVTQLKVIKAAAEEQKVKLTNDEKDEAVQKAEEMIQTATQQDKQEYYLSVQSLSDIYEENALADKMFYVATDDVDNNISDEEAKQTSISYITVSTAGTEKDDDGKTIDLTDEEKAAKKEIAQRFLDLLKESEDPATASITDLRKELNDQLNVENTADSTDSADGSDESSSSSDASDTSASDASSASTSSSSDSDSSSEVSYLTSSETSFGTGSEKDDDDTCSLGDKVAEEAAKLKDGEYYDGVIEGDDAYYVIRVDKAFDEDKTESRRQTIISNRKSDKYNDTLDGWVKEVASNWKKLEVTDADLYTMTVDSASTDSTDGTTTDSTTTDSTATDSTTSDSTTSGSTETTSTSSTGTASTSSSTAE